MMSKSWKVSPRTLCRVATILSAVMCVCQKSFSTSAQPAACTASARIFCQELRICATPAKCRTAAPRPGCHSASATQSVESRRPSAPRMPQQACSMTSRSSSSLSGTLRKMPCTSPVPTTVRRKSAEAISPDLDCTSLMRSINVSAHGTPWSFSPLTDLQCPRFRCLASACMLSNKLRARAASEAPARDAKTSGVSFFVVVISDKAIERF
mmetsp:Transcript_65612/g.188800  ORF Transcript_65612/g.188800 Transcript_65612/m.188800 type:complete len:210 (-) Transcript_65612:271-900(-)